MNAFTAWLVSPDLIDLILVLIGIEALALMITRRGQGGSYGRFDILLTLLPGAFVFLALRMALAGAAWPWVPAALAASLIAHGLDLWARLRG